MNEMVRAVCSRSKKPHTLATVLAGPGGAHVVELREAVRGIDGLFAVRRSVPLADFEGRSLFCGPCGKRYFLGDAQLSDAIRRRVRRLTLEPYGYLLDPIGVLDRRRGRTSRYPHGQDPA